MVNEQEPVMAEKDLEASDIERKVHDLAASMERIRTRQADRDDVVVDMKHARLSRLELLSQNLAPVFKDLPNENDQFEFAISQGETPRLWIDMTSFVRMAGDGREYEFVKDTRLGRKILGRSESVEQIGEHVTDYVAERVLERERMIEGDWISANEILAQADPDEETDETATNHAMVSQARHSSLNLALWFVIGLLAGGGLLLAAVWFDQLDAIINWVSGLSR